MSFNENSSLSANEFETWQSQVPQQNQQIDRMLEDMLINSSNLFNTDQPPRARRRYRERQREIGETRLMKDYFVDNPTYDEDSFRRRFRMRRPLFCRIVDVVIANDEYFQQRPDATGSLNDINVLHRSSVFDDVLTGQAPKVSYIVNGRERNKAYYLTDDIYSSWATFVKSITSPTMPKHKLFTQRQESVIKDVERAFGVLQARFAFIRRPCLVWDKYNMGRIMIACIIMHNMIVEDERDT